MKRLLLLGCSLLATIANAADQRPNVVLIIAHDLGRDWVSCYESDHQTPNLDRLANEGVRYETAWSMLDARLSHDALLLGRYPSRLKERQPSLIDLLVKAGYTRINYEIDGELKLTGKSPYLLLCALPVGIGNYAGQVKKLDERAGKLARATADENTFLLFTSTGGSPVPGKLNGDEQPVGKRAKADCGAHVPFIIRAPFLFKGGRVSRDLTDFTDLFPTLLELANIEKPNHLKLDGHTLLPSLRGSDDPFEKRNWVVSESSGFRMARDWHHILDTNGRFHDLDKDPLQQHQVSVQDKQAPHRRQRLQMILDRFETNAEVRSETPTP
ncbi:MAG: hypothetical protein CMO80_05755 [Verrucomicrobiales bacterium]|nr:hypothetical protein [Verrucomicrobiales bacterium]|tara:strand:+ start:5365 stop:6345 length:981 start_codon:yes stop_codon:yes gene_type:complete